MAQAIFSVNMDGTLKEQFDSLCTECGKDIREKAMQAFIALREQSGRNYPDGMSLEEINYEIHKARCSNGIIYFNSKTNA